MSTLKAYPSSNGSVLSKGTFTNPTNGYADDGSYAELAADDRNDVNAVYYGGFNFSAIPAGATINSVTIECQFHYANGAGATDSFGIQARKSSVAQGTQAQYNSQPTSDYTLQNSNTGSWTLSDLANLDVYAEWDRGNTSAADTINIDYCAVTVDYTYTTTVTAAATLTGAGSIEASAVQEILAQAALMGAGSIEASAMQKILAQAALMGAGSITADGVQELMAQAALTGAGSIIASAVQEILAQAALTGAGSIEATALTGYMGKATLTGSGDLTASAQVDCFGQATLTGSGDVIASAQGVIYGQAALTGAGFITADASWKIKAQAALTGAGSITAEGFQEIQGQAGLTGDGSIEAEGLQEIQGQAGLTGAGKIEVVQSQVTVYAQAQLTGSGDLTLNVTITAAAQLTGSGELTVAATVRPDQLIATVSLQERTASLTLQEAAATVTMQPAGATSEVVQLPLIGNTVRLKVEFTDFAGTLASPDSVVFRIYNEYYEQIGEDIPITETSVGVFQYDYTIPAGTSPLYYEFAGTLDGSIVLARGLIERSWV